MKARVLDLMSVVTLAASAVASALVYSRLPDPIATHFDIHGTPNGFMPRPFGAFFMPVFGLLVWAFVRVVGRFSPRGDKKGVSPQALSLVGFLTAAFLAVIHVVILHVALRPGASVIQPTFLALGAFFLALAVILPRLRQNGVAGVRTPWTLASPEVWARTQRFASYSMAAGGLAVIVAALIGGSAATTFAIAVLLATAIAPAVYSFYVARSLTTK